MNYAAVRDELTERGLSVRGFAKLAGIPHSTLGSMMSRKQSPNPLTHERICRGLDRYDSCEIIEYKTFWCRL